MFRHTKKSIRKKFLNKIDHIMLEPLHLYHSKQMSELKCRIAARTALSADAAASLRQQYHLYAPIYSDAV